MRKLVLSAVILASLSLTTSSFADFTENDDGTLIYANSPEGPFLVTDQEGQFLRIWVIERVPVEFPDRRGIRKAYTLAEERAKGRLVRYMGEQVSATRIATEFQADLSTARQTRGTDAARSVTKVDERQVVEALAEINTSFAAGQLRGITILAQGYDDTLDEAWVQVGYSRNSLAGAQLSKDALRLSEADQEGSSESTDELGFQKGQIRSLPNRNW